MKAKSVNDVGSMALYSMLYVTPNYYFVALLNSELLFDYYRDYINCTVNIQINDIRQLPIIIPTEKQLKKIEIIFHKAVSLKKDSNSIIELNELENELEKDIRILYEI